MPRRRAEARRGTVWPRSSEGAAYRNEPRSGACWRPLASTSPTAGISATTGERDVRPDIGPPRLDRRPGGAYPPRRGKPPERPANGGAPPGGDPPAAPSRSGWVVSGGSVARHCRRCLLIGGLLLA